VKRSQFAKDTLLLRAFLHYLWGAASSHRGVSLPELEGRGLAISRATADIGNISLATSLTIR